MLDSKKRKKQCIIMFMVLLPIFLYLSWSLAALFSVSDLTVDNLKQHLLYSLSHFYLQGKNNDKTAPCILLGVVIWLLCFMTYYTKMSLNLMHGQEYGTASFGSIKKFNKKYASERDSENNASK